VGEGNRWCRGEAGVAEGGGSPKVRDFRLSMDEKRSLFGLTQQNTKTKKK